MPRWLLDKDAEVKETHGRKQNEGDCGIVTTRPRNGAVRESKVCSMEPTQMRNKQEVGYASIDGTIDTAINRMAHF